MDDKEILGFALRLLRENAGFNREEIAEKVRRTPDAVGRHEAGKKAPALDEVTAYLRATGCRFAELEALVEALRRFRERLKSGPGWWTPESPETARDEAQRLEHERIAHEVGAAAGRLAQEFLPCRGAFAAPLVAECPEKTAKTAPNPHTAPRPVAARSTNSGAVELGAYH